MSKKKLFSSYRWNELPIIGKVEKGKEQSKEEEIEGEKTLLKILVDRKEMSQEEADERLSNFIESLNK
ncbi:MAG: hypothetical protein J6K45_06485 [Clostridia bacterium]|nr:hypothetical protein [Clostridia bacterium]